MKTQFSKPTTYCLWNDSSSILKTQICPKPVLRFVLVWCYFRCTMQNFCFIIYTSTLVAFMGWTLPSLQEVSIVQSFNCIKNYLSPIIALVGLSFPIFPFLVIQLGILYETLTSKVWLIWNSFYWASVVYCVNLFEGLFCSIQLLKIHEFTLNKKTFCSGYVVNNYIHKTKVTQD